MISLRFLDIMCVKNNGDSLILCVEISVCALLFGLAIDVLKKAFSLSDLVFENLNLLLVVDSSDSVC